MSFQTLDQADLQGKRALVRVDFNVPLSHEKGEDGQVTDDTRLRAAKPTIDKLRAGGAKVILLAHFDRPKGKRVPGMSLKPIVAPLAKVLGVPVAFAEDCIGPKAREAVAAMAPGDVLLLENVRFHPGEEANDRKFADALAANGDLYVNDAFSAAHRAHASTEGVTKFLKPAVAGFLLQKELDYLVRHRRRLVQRLLMLQLAGWRRFKAGAPFCGNSGRLQGVVQDWGHRDPSIEV